MKNDAEQNQDTENLQVDVGALLRYTREQYGQKIADIERALRIRGSQIEAIERGDVSKLPGPVYVVGFVRTYAEYLGLDGAEIVKQYKATYLNTSSAGKQTLSFPVPASESKIPSIFVVVISTVVILLLFSGYLLMGQQKTDRSFAREVESVPEELKERLTEENNSAQIEVEENKTDLVSNTQAEPVKKGILLNIQEESWVEIKDGGGKNLVSETLHAGDQYFVPDSPGLSMSLGNAGGVQIVLDGKILKPLGKKGDIRRDIPLDTGYLKTLEFEDEAQEEIAPAEEGKASPSPSQDVQSAPEH